jgi:hypothetical protein
VMGHQIEMADFPIIPQVRWRSRLLRPHCGQYQRQRRGAFLECGAVLGVIDSAILSELVSLIPTPQG